MKKLHKTMVLALVAFLLAFGVRAAHAEEIVTVTTVPTPTPAPALAAPVTPEPSPTPTPFYPEYKWTRDEIDYPAAMAYAECNTDSEKEGALTVAWNRAHSGNPIFADNIVDVCKQPGEFNLGRVTDRNRAIVAYNLNRLQGRWLGIDTGIKVPESAVYMGRVNGVLTLYDIDKNVVWKCGK